MVQYIDRTLSNICVKLVWTVAQCIYANTNLLRYLDAGFSCIQTVNRLKYKCKVGLDSTAPYICKYKLTDLFTLDVGLVVSIL